jgi:hypothetical protein
MREGWPVPLRCRCIAPSPDVVPRRGNSGACRRPDRRYGPRIEPRARRLARDTGQTTSDPFRERWISRTVGHRSAGGSRRELEP